ncbi:MAG: thioredoxin [Acutalibacteraceae bacterium]
MEINLTSKNFESVVMGSEIPVLIDFWAEWCGPCMMLSPIVAEIAEENDELLVCKVNVDEEQELAVAFGIESIPALFVIKDGKIVNQTVGYHSKEDILALVGEN